MTRLDCDMCAVPVHAVVSCYAASVLCDICSAMLKLQFLVAVDPEIDEIRQTTIPGRRPVSEAPHHIYDGN